MMEALAALATAWGMIGIWFITMDLSRTNRALERIADALEKK